ncbi:MAG: hypothetical protein E6J20_20325 [Chloroflexi bacterium]|nr:MAG: hypothetical protein E6J20_20325 [Chloroflexota bacterium]
MISAAPASCKVAFTIAPSPSSRHLRQSVGGVPPPVPPPAPPPPPPPKPPPPRPKPPPVKHPDGPAGTTVTVRAATVPEASLGPVARTQSLSWRSPRLADSAWVTRTVVGTITVWATPVVGCRVTEVPLTAVTWPRAGAVDRLADEHHGRGQRPGAVLAAGDHRAAAGDDVGDRPGARLRERRVADIHGHITGLGIDDQGGAVDPHQLAGGRVAAEAATAGAAARRGAARASRAGRGAAAARRQGEQGRRRGGGGENSVHGRSPRRDMGLVAGRITGRAARRWGRGARRVRRDRHRR